MDVPLPTYEEYGPVLTPEEYALLDGRAKLSPIRYNDTTDKLIPMTVLLFSEFHVALLAWKINGVLHRGWVSTNTIYGWIQAREDVVAGRYYPDMEAALLVSRMKIEDNGDNDGD